MARARYLKPTFFTNERIGDLAPLERLAWQGLWCAADREGRLKDRPKSLRIEILPYDDVDFDGLLGALELAGFIVRYQVNGERYIAIPSFLEHQKPHPKEAVSTIPEPPLTGASVKHKSSMNQASANHSETIPTCPRYNGMNVKSELENGEGMESAPEAPAPEKKPRQESSGKPLPLPKKTTPTEEWAAEMREKYRLRDFDETLRFHMNGSYYRTCADKCTFLEKKLEAAAEREATMKGGTNGRTPTRRGNDAEHADQLAHFYAIANQ